jgi:hypothetical protein
MFELFEGYWWLMFPLCWFVVGVWRNWLAYRAEREAMDVLAAYARNGREPPAELIARLGR